MPNELNPCAKCGGEAKVTICKSREYDAGKLKAYEATCTVCGRRFINTWLPSEERTRDAWNAANPKEEEKHA